MLRLNPWQRVAIWTVLLVILLVTLAPFFWMLSTSMKDRADVFRSPPELLPDRFTLHNYFEVLRRIPYLGYLWNSTVVATTATCGVLLFCSMAGYAFARLRFPGRSLFFGLFLASMMIPFQVTVIPLFMAMAKLGMMDRYLGLVAPALSSAYGVFLMRQFFMGLPRDLENAARLDGASEWAIFSRIFLPLARPALTTLGILTFVTHWTDFLWPLLITNSRSMRTLEVGLSYLQDEHSVDWPLWMAACVLVMLPVLILFFVAHRHLVKGIALTGMKG